MIEKSYGVLPNELFMVSARMEVYTKPFMVKPRTVRKLTAAKRTDDSPQHDKYFSRAVSKALETLEFLKNETNSMSMNDIAKRLQLSKTSAFRLLKTLEATGYVTQDGRGQYKLAPGIHAVAPTQWLNKLVRIALPHMQALTHELAETVSLAALFDNRIEVVSVIESPHVIRMSNVVGHILPPNASSLGKAITAFQSPSVRERLLRSFKIYRFTDRTITDPRDLEREYESICYQRFAVDREECDNDGICFSVPIFGPNEEVSAAISLSMPKFRLRGEEQEASIIAALRGTTTTIARNL
jgi:IclR family acetate operon transcriptional repressor